VHPEYVTRREHRISTLIRCLIYVCSSGLRKKVTVFQQPHYSESFVASILLSIPEGVEGTVKATKCVKPLQTQ